MYPWSACASCPEWTRGPGTTWIPCDPCDLGQHSVMALTWADVVCDFVRQTIDSKDQKQIQKAREDLLTGTAVADAVKQLTAAWRGPPDEVLVDAKLWVVGLSKYITFRMPAGASIGDLRQTVSDVHKYPLHAFDIEWNGVVLDDSVRLGTQYKVGGHGAVCPRFFATWHLTDPGVTRPTIITHDGAVERTFRTPYDASTTVGDVVEAVARELQVPAGTLCLQAPDQSETYSNDAILWRIWVSYQVDVYVIRPAAPSMGSCVGSK